MASPTTIEKSEKIKPCDDRCVHPTCMDLRRKFREAEVDRLVTMHADAEGIEPEFVGEVIRRLAILAKERF